MAKMRTAAQAFKDIKANDPNTSISERMIRDLFKSGKIPVIRRGRVTLADLNVIDAYFDHPES